MIASKLTPIKTQGDPWSLAYHSCDRLSSTNKQSSASIEESVTWKQLLILQTFSGSGMSEGAMRNQLTSLSFGNPPSLTDSKSLQASERRNIPTESHLSCGLYQV
ncbi:hypothetical protein F2Q69_00048141 [Brassica cretica]|uniref:Uncharacterized protein n=1 Tax=Brassica cretica TaxID=69181 RepID=A0A8S9PXZ1_BRACR|nr:hypothetical protein F2Q69_00048141 [Brassica cretica]